MAKKRRIRKKTAAELADAEFRQKSNRKVAIRTAAHAVCKRLSKKRAAFILDIADNAWTQRIDYDWGSPQFEKEERHWTKLRKQFLRDATDPIELHMFASNWNCDRGPTPIQQIIKQPHCDAGTALWLYWDNDPYFYQAYRLLSDADDEETGAWLRISRNIERRFRRGDFATSRIPFDPEPWVTDRYAESEWVAHKIPDVMYRPVVPRGRKKCT